uniref:Uncharacterized protein n=1 Tax=Candidatus Kentrum sp. TC TaxID=2126339 RepID=A0A450Z2N7_9GAMM|nr:MAG: hypothetical protein BECKTC1821E_GA0114239_11005 [Candidatus Kentron sp. TC]
MPETSRNFHGIYTGTPNATVRSEPSVPHGINQDFTLRAIMELQQSTGHLTAAMQSLKETVDKQETRLQEAIDKQGVSLKETIESRETRIVKAIEKQDERIAKLEQSVSDISKKIYAAGAILSIVVIFVGLVTKIPWSSMPG